MREKGSLAVFSKDKSATIMIPKKITACSSHATCVHCTEGPLSFPAVCSSGKLKGVGWEVEGARSTQKARVLLLHSVQSWEIEEETILSAPIRSVNSLAKQMIFNRFYQPK